MADSKKDQAPEKGAPEIHGTEAQKEAQRAYNEAKAEEQPPRVPEDAELHGTPAQVEAQKAYNRASGDTPAG